MKRWYQWAVPWLCLSLIAGCTTLQEYLDIGRDKGLSADYLASLERWTRSKIVYSQFETKVLISATCRSRDFNQAYLKEYARVYQQGDEDRGKQVALLDAEAKDFSEFVFYAYLPEKATNDFDRRGSIWSVFLLNDLGERISPLELRRIDPVNQIVRDFFPYINPHYGIAYRLRFPPNQFRGKMKLVFTGVVATVELAYPGP